jgi:tetratricopeptide (TPR) repeat protein
LLDEAEKVSRRALELAPSDAGVMFDRGWILDERGDFSAAVEAYREAQKLDIKGERPNITYNLACSLSKWGKTHLKECLQELRKVIKLDNNAELAKIDPDFENVRKDEETAAEFEALLSKSA